MGCAPGLLALPPPGGWEVMGEHSSGPEFPCEARDCSPVPALSASLRARGGRSTSTELENLASALQELVEEKNH